MAKSKDSANETRKIKQKQVIALVVYVVVVVLPWFSQPRDSETTGVGEALSAAFATLFLLWATPLVTWIFIWVQYHYFKKRGSRWAIPFRVVTVLIPVCFAMWGLIYFLNKPIN